MDEIERLRRERDAHRSLEQMVRSISTESQPERLFPLVMDHALALTRAERGFLILTKPDGAFDIRVARNLDREAIHHPQFKVSTGIIEEVARSGTSVAVASAQQDPRFQARASVGRLGLASVACFPLQSGGRTIGVLYLDNRFVEGLFQADDLPILQAFADHAAIAIRNAQLLAENLARAEELERLNRKLEERVAEQGVRLADVETKLRRKQEELELKYRYDQIVGRSPAMQEVFHLLDRVTDSREPVLVAGESGTGKELVARAIHYNGPRKGGPFVSENCGAIAESLFESELFGHVRGAFTGAERDHAGLFQRAHGGTLFLDEVGEISLPMQSKFLRVLEEKTVRPVGGSQSVPVDVRIVAATNRDLKAEVAEGRFREDLYYRLNVVSILVPPLRARRDDIPLLVEHFLRSLCLAAGRQPPEVAPAALALLMDYPWPGNVRELENEVRRLVALAGPTVGLEDLSPSIRRREPLADRDEMVSLEELEIRHIRRVLERVGGNATQASKVLGIDPSTLWRKMKRYGLR